jgi:hypothetical protein
MSTTDDCDECQHQKRTGHPLTVAKVLPRANPALRNGDRVTIRTGLDAGKRAQIVGRDGARIKVRLESGTVLSVRSQELDLPRRNPDGSDNKTLGTMLLILGTLSIVFGIILPAVMQRPANNN